MSASCLINYLSNESTLFSIQFNSIHAFISDKSRYYTGYINYTHRLLRIN